MYGGFTMPNRSMNTITRIGSITGCIEVRCSICWMCFAVLYMAMKGGTMMIQPNNTAMSDLAGLIDPSRSYRRSSSLTW